MGSALLRQWLQRPLLDRGQIVRRQNYVEAFVTSPDTFNELHGKLMKGLPDIDVLYKKFLEWTPDVSTADTIKMLLQFYDLVDRVERIVQLLENNDGPYALMLRAEIIKPARADLLPNLRLFVELVERHVDLEATERGVYRLRPERDAELQILTRTLDENKEVMDQLVLKASGDLQLNTDLMHQAELRKGHEKVWHARQASLVLEVMNAVARFLPSLRIVNAIVTELDCFLGMAQAALTAPTQYVRPEVLPLGSDAIRLVEARHPCVELTASAKSGGSFIPNDVTMERDTSRMQILTGPNMGGKSTYIRMTGVICVMAQVGSFVPCATAQLPLMANVIASLGGEEHQGTSSFMAGMVEAASIVKSVTDNSLVIIDDLCRGTNPHEGFGLELNGLSQVPGAVSLHFAAPLNNAMPFQVRAGPSDQSDGILVAQLASFPPSVVSMASDMQKQLNKFGNVEIVPTAKSEPQKEKKQQSPSPTSSSQLSAAAAQVQSVSSSGGKRVQSDSDLGELVPLNAYETEVLSMPLDSFKNAAGQVDREKYRAFLAATRAKHGLPPTVKREPKNSS